MKKTLTLLLALVLCLSAVLLAGCKKKQEEINGPESFMKNYNFESYVDEDSTILGSWAETLSEDNKSDKTIWRFQDTTALNIVESVKERELTTPCAYNFDEKTGKLVYLNCNTKDIITVNVTIDGDNMTFTDEDGSVTKTFVKQ